mgnify:FL=1
MPEIQIPNLTETQKVFASVMENQISLNTAINALQEVQSKHHTILLDGAGEVPLVETVRIHAAFIDNIRYWSRFVFGAIIIQTITFGVAVIIAVVRFLPLLENLAKP